MLPLKLTLKGLYSYQKEQTIDFTNLTAGSLFGIFGKVGSGKSSILEAISFSLYGETERLNLRDNRSYNMMNLKCGELYIEFIFRAGVKNLEYRSVISCKRHKAIFEKVPSLERRAYRKEVAEWIPMEVSEIPEIIGLSYENFRRTIIIPQEKFSEFLKLGDKDRTEMLKEIFKLERFEYSSKVASLEKKNNEKINTLTGKIEQLGEIDENEIKIQKERRQLLIENEEKLNKLLEDKTKEEHQLSLLKDLFHKLRIAKSQLEKLQRQEGYFKNLEKEIYDYEFSLINFKPIIDLKREATSKFLLTKGDLIKLRQTNEKLHSVLKVQEEEFNIVHSQYLAKDQLLARSEELKKIKAILNLRKEIAHTEERIVKGTKLIDEVEKEIDQKQKLRANLRDSILQKKEDLPDIGKLKEIDDWFNTQKVLNDNVERIKKEILVLERAVSTLIESDNHYAISELFGWNKTKEQPQDSHYFFKLLKLEKGKIEKDIEETSNQIEVALVETKLQEFSKNLKANQPCPLCGSTHHPHALEKTGASEKLNNLTDKRKHLVETHKKVENLIEEEQKKLFKIENLFNSIDKEKSNLMLAAKQLNLHLSTFRWVQYDCFKPEQVREQFKTSQKIIAELNSMESKLEEIQKQLDENQKLKEKYNQGVQQLLLALSSKKSEKATYKSQIKFFDLQQSFNAESIDKEIQKLEDQFQIVTQSYESLLAQITQVKEQTAKNEGQIDEIKKKLQELKVALESTDNEIALVLKGSHFHEIGVVEAILARKIDLEIEKERLGNFHDEVTVIKRQLKSLEEEVSEKQFEEDNHRALIDEINSIKHQINDTNMELGKLGSEIKQLENDLKERNKLQKELGTLTLRKEDIGVMKQLFKGSGFVNYVSTIFLRNLCNAANDRFYKLTRQKLRLELTENNNFQVRDFLNNGQVRSVKTLSGGQTFQASLSLALALAESIQKQNNSEQNFFFLDEGFGSLDKDSLEIVFETLKSLRKENRIVGIISHVSELQQEIDVYLHIHNDEENGSVIKGSWE